MLVALLGDHHVFAVCTGDGRYKSVGAHCGEDPVKALSLDHFRRGFRVQAELDAQFLDQLDLIVHELGQVILKGDLLREHQLAAKTIRFFKNRHVMSPLGRNDRRLHAGGAAADNTNLLGCSGFGNQILQLILPAHGGVHGAGKRAGIRLGVLQTVEALDAGNDLVLLAVAGLFRHLGIGDGAAGHSNEVRAAGGQRFLHELGILEGAQRQNRLRHAQLFDAAGKPGILGGLVEDGRVHNGLSAGNGHVARGDVGDVDAVAGHPQELGNVLRHELLVRIGIAHRVRQLAAGDTILNEDLLSHPLPDGVQNHHGEPAAVLEGAAELIGTLVEQRAHKPVDHQAMAAVNENGVKADLNRSFRHIGVILGDGLHSLPGQHRTLGAVGAGRTVHRIEEVLALTLLAAGPPGIEERQQLNGRLRAIEMDLIHCADPIAVIGALPQVQVVPAGPERRKAVHVVTGNGYGRSAAPCLFHIVGAVGVCGIRLICLQQMRSRRRLENTVLEYHVSNFIGAEQRGILRMCHKKSPLLIITCLFYRIPVRIATILQVTFSVLMLHNPHPNCDTYVTSIPPTCKASAAFSSMFPFTRT